MTCTHCNKRLSRKTARQIDGVIMCSACMFTPPKAEVIYEPEGEG
jgi:hypothetical protein